MNTSVAVSIYEQSLDLVEKYGKYLKKEHGDLDQLREIAKCILHFTRATELDYATKKVFEEFDVEIEKSKEELDCDLILKQFDEKINKVNEQLSNSENNSRYQCFLESINEQTDDDIVTVLQNINNIDPITKLPIVEPVKNKKCGHVYEKSSILELIKRNPKTKCPIPGCVTSNYIKKEDLVFDHTLKRILMDQPCKNISKKIKLN